MPVWLRKFTFETLREHYDKMNDENKKKDNDLPRPNITPKQPTYTAKAPKK